jgi:hypothetical protein
MAEEKPVGSCIVRPDAKPLGLNLSLLAYRSPTTSNAYVMNFKVRWLTAAHCSHQASKCNPKANSRYQSCH